MKQGVPVIQYCSLYVFFEKGKQNNVKGKKNEVSEISVRLKSYSKAHVFPNVNSNSQKAFA